MRLIFCAAERALRAVMAAFLLSTVLGACNSPLPRPTDRSQQPPASLSSQPTANGVGIARCWNMPANARDAKDLFVEIRVVVDPDGYVLQATIVDQARLDSDPRFRAAAESARRAFFNPLCRPLHLPPDEYELWKDMIVKMGPEDTL